MNTHDLKTWLKPFQAVWDGVKTYEIRKDDRDFKVGDQIRLREYEPEVCGGLVQYTPPHYTDRLILASITYKTSGGEWGIPEGMCVLGIKVLLRGTATGEIATIERPETAVVTAINTNLQFAPRGCREAMLAARDILSRT